MHRLGERYYNSDQKRIPAKTMLEWQMKIIEK